MIRVRLLGRFQIDNDGTLVEFPTAKVKELAAYLLWRQGSWVERAECRDALWPDCRESAGSASLRQSVYRLRGSLADAGCADLLSVARSALRITTPADASIDADEYVGATRTVHSLDVRMTDPTFEVLDTRAHLLTEFDSVWAEDARTTFERFQRDSIRRATELLSDTTDSHAALAHAERWLEFEPLSESVHRTLIELHLRNGDRSAAIAQYKRCCALLASELGIEPAPETTALIENALGGRVIDEHPGSDLA